MCVCVCFPLSRFQSSPPSRSSPAHSSTQPPPHIAAGPSTAAIGGGGGGGGGGRGEDSTHLKEHLEAAETELFELKSVLRAKACSAALTTYLCCMLFCAVLCCVAVCCLMSCPLVHVIVCVYCMAPSTTLCVFVLCEGGGDGRAERSTRAKAGEDEDTTGRAQAGLATA